MKQSVEMLKGDVITCGRRPKREQRKRTFKAGRHFPLLFKPHFKPAGFSFLFFALFPSPDSSNRAIRLSSNVPFLPLAKKQKNTSGFQSQIPLRLLGCLYSFGKARFVPRLAVILESFFSILLRTHFEFPF
ncbi:hypothetical protein IM774_02780 [Erysipelotrichaceae bacterium RD49]|nr:hypothetical protein [Erysipelotrichaceae bacterium RD49]